MESNVFATIFQKNILNIRLDLKMAITDQYVGSQSQCVSKITPVWLITFRKMYCPNAYLNILLVHCKRKSTYLSNLSF